MATGIFAEAAREEMQRTRDDVEKTRADGKETRADVERTRDDGKRTRDDRIRTRKNGKRARHDGKWTRDDRKRARNDVQGAHMKANQAHLEGKAAHIGIVTGQTFKKTIGIYKDKQLLLLIPQKSLQKQQGFETLPSKMENPRAVQGGLGRRGVPWTPEKLLFS